MTREELRKHCEKEIRICEFWAHGRAEELNNNKIYQEHKLILELLERQPCEDAISRQAAIDGIGAKSDEMYETKMKGATFPHDDFFQGMAYAANIVENLPPVQPKERTEKRTETPACDCISRQAAIHIASGYCHPANIAAELAKLPSVQPEQRWIPVSERLPEKDMRCLVAFGRFNYFTEIATYSDLMGIIDCKIFYQGDVGHDNFANITQYVKAWMPLPEPYKAESEAAE